MYREQPKIEDGDKSEVSAKDNPNIMGAKQGKGNQSKCSSTLTAHEEMHGRGRGMGLPAIIEQENLLEKPEKKFGDREECHQSLLYESDEETRGWETPQRLVKHRERIRAVRSGSCNSDTSFDQPKDSFSIRSDTAGSVTKITSDYSSWEEEEGRPTNMIHQCSKETCSSCSSSNFPMKRPQNDSQLLSPDIRGERRTSVVQFADDEPKSDKKRRLSPASKIFQSVNSRNQRRSTVGNVYDQIISSQFDDRRGSMPPNLNRNQLGHSSKKTFTVVNYGKVEGDASETVPTGRESVTVLELLDDDDDTPGSPTPSIVLPDVNNGDKGVQQDDPIFQVVNVGGGRRLSVFHINNVISPDADKVFEDEVDCPQSVAVTIEDHTKCNASVEKRNRQVQAMVTWGKDYGRRKKDRLVNKDGVINIRTAKISKRNYQFMLDLFTTLLDLQWRWVWFLFAVAFLLSWFGFGVIWWLIAWLHGDFEPRTGASPPPCIDNLDGLISAFLYSIETQHTIGYGSRALSTECPLAFVALIAQSLLGVIVQCVMAGVVFAKLAKPKNRAETVMFSSTANICLEDGEYCLVFRVGDMRRSQLVGCNLRAFLVRRHVTLEGRVIPFHTSHLHVQAECEEHDQSLFLAWPTRIIHRITPDSPLWKVGAEDLLREQFEIIVVLEATIESSGMTTQIRTSYLPCEIQWGQTFRPLLTVQKSNTQVVIDYSNFHKTDIQHMPGLSAMVYAMRSSIGGYRHRYGSCRSNVNLSIRSRADSCHQGSRFGAFL